MRTHNSELQRKHHGSRLSLALAAMVFSLAGTARAGTVEYDFSAVGSNLYRYSFILADMALNSHQALEIRFDPAIYASLTDGVAGSDFSLTLLQPNNPPGTFGDYNVLALTDNASLQGPFGVAVSFVGAVQPGSQSFVINQFDEAGKYLSTIDSGITTAVTGSVPEPDTTLLVQAVLLAGGAWWGLRRRSRRI
jgi:hypothetical protein